MRWTSYGPLVNCNGNEYAVGRTKITNLVQQHGVGLRDPVNQLAALGQADGKGLEGAVHRGVCRKKSKT